MSKEQPYPLHKHILVIGETGKYTLRSPEKKSSGNRARARKRVRWGDDMALRVAEIAPAPPVVHDATEWEVYVIGPHDGHLKIGMAKDVAARLRTLQCASPVDLYVHFSATVDRDRAAKIERACHDDLAQHRMRGEWFDVPLDKAIETLRRNVRGFMGIHHQF